MCCTKIHLVTIYCWRLYFLLSRNWPGAAAKLTIYCWSNQLLLVQSSFATAGEFTCYCNRNFFSLHMVSLFASHELIFYCYENHFQFILCKVHNYRNMYEFPLHWFQFSSWCLCTLKMSTLCMYGATSLLQRFHTWCFWIYYNTELGVHMFWQGLLWSDITTTKFCNVFATSCSCLWVAGLHKMFTFPTQLIPYAHCKLASHNKSNTHNSLVHNMFTYTTCSPQVFMKILC